MTIFGIAWGFLARPIASPIAGFTTILPGGWKNSEDILGLRLLQESLLDYTVNFLCSTEVSPKAELQNLSHSVQHHISSLHTTSAIYIYCNFSSSCNKSSYSSHEELSWIREYNS